MSNTKNVHLEGLWDHLLDVSNSGNSSLQSTLKTNLTKAIFDGRIPEGTRLPSTRLLAANLRVARVTVGLAYEALATRGLLVAQPKRGYFVAQGVQDRHKAGGKDISNLFDTPRWSSYLETLAKGEKWLGSSQPLAEFPYSFASGKIDHHLFSPEDWQECVAQAAAERDNWTADAGDGDDPFLIEQICNHILPKRGINVSHDEVLVTMGTQMGLYLLSELLILPDTEVAMEEPGYMGARNVFLRRGAKIVPIQVDRDGAIPPDTMAKCSFIYLTPGHQTPTGVVLSDERRHTFLDLARHSQSLIIEDDYEAETGFGEKLTPALKAIDQSGHVIYLGSFSNSVAPGLRIGFIVGHKKLIDRARQLRRLITRHTPGNNQQTLALFIGHGYYERSLQRQRALLESRAEVLAGSLRRHLPSWAFSKPVGGSNFWVQAPTDIDMKKVESRAREKGVLIESGDAFYHSVEFPRYFGRLTYSAIASDEIETGIQLLAQAVAESQRLS